MMMLMMTMMLLLMMMMMMPLPVQIRCAPLHGAERDDAGPAADEAPRERAAPLDF
jgi:hypothetical protein